MTLLDPQNLAALATLTVLEIVLGIDNIVFIAVSAARLPKEQQAAARRLGLAFALFTRLALLGAIAWIAQLTAPIAGVLGQTVSWRDAILFGGGLFLLYKGTFEIHETVEGGEDGAPRAARARSFAGVVAQIAVIDIVFSLDSVITAVGMAEDFAIMATAILLAIVV